MATAPQETSSPPVAEPSVEPVPLSIKFFYGSGSIAEGVKDAAFKSYLLFYYNNVLGLSGSKAGLAILIALFVDAITDPLVGSFSDNFRSRWGRRHPFMFAAAAPMAICLYLLFSPPTLSENGLFLWMVVFAVGVRASMTFYSIPSSAMVPQITAHYDERTSLVSWRYLMGWIGAVAASLMMLLYFLAPTSEYVQGQLNPAGYAAFGAMAAVIVFLAILSCAWGTRKLIPQLHGSATSDGFSLARLMGELKDTFGNRSYQMIVLGAMFGAVAGGFSDSVGLYMNTYFWGFTTQQLSLLVFPLAVSIFGAFALTRTLTERWDKRGAALRLATFAVFVGPLPVFLRLAGLMPENGDPLLLGLIMVHAGVVVMPLISIGIIASSMIADIVDQSELETGHRREGMFASAIAFIQKAASGLGTFAAGIALDMVAFPRGAEVGAVSQDKVTSLGIAVGPGLMLFFLLTLFFLSRYRMTREDHAEILTALEARSAGADASAPS